MVQWWMMSWAGEVNLVLIFFNMALSAARHDKLRSLFSRYLKIQHFFLDTYCDQLFVVQHWGFPILP